MQSYSASGTIVTAAVVGPGNETFAAQALTAAQLRSTSWTDLPLAVASPA